MAAKKVRGEAERSKRGRKWSHQVTTVSTFPPEGTFTRDADSIARTMASKEVSPKGIGSGIRMLQFFINRAGKNLPADRRAELEKAKRILQEQRRREANSRPSKAKKSSSEPMIRKLKSGEFRLYSRKVNPKTGRRRNLGTFPTREQAERHEREIQFFKRAH